MEGQKKGGCCSSILMLAVAVFAAFIIYLEHNTIGLNLLNFAEDHLDMPITDGQQAWIESETDPVWQLKEDATVITEDMVLPDYEAELIEKGDHIINILLIGQDRQEGQLRTRADTMILCTINTRDKTMVLTSFLRDLYVKIPDWNGDAYLDNRLNVCYAYGDTGLLNKALKQNFGVQVDHNIVVDFDSFANVVDYFGGVSVYLTKEEAAYMGHGLVEGTNRLHSEQALQFVRIRKLDSDFGRTDRQRRLLQGIYNYVKDMNHTQLMKLARGVLPLVSTDMTNNELAICIGKIQDVLPELTVTSQCIPAAGTYQDVYIREMAVLLPDLDANNAILKETLE